MMALDTSFLSSHQSLLDWDQLSFGISDFHDIISSGMDSSSSSDASIGFLQDAFTNSSESCKRRKKFSALSEPEIANYEDLNYLIQDFWDSSASDPPEILNCVTESTVASDDQLTSLFLESPSLPPQTAPDHNAEPNSTESDNLSAGRKPSSPSFTQNFLIFPQNGNKKKRSINVVHPFAAVKPAGLEGDLTLDDINEKILMRPARPVRHPVGEFACGPAVSFDGPSLSGKSVVSLMRIQTRGTGSITIIRTRG
ncbi:hypothetical protein LUZ63_008318 [Rhynchospora breviuscula]|uniref:Protein XRI1-like n=1 Tax=Rhynchospora breviuscula TaxID=2022672 RepID=A0A9Q0HVD9_9POAL|nr:hypothetical protein LUZ63_008318 [Rhynchospora breviuscula]